MNTEKKEILNISVARWYDPFISIFLAIGTFYYLYPTGISNTFLVLSIMAVCTIYFVLSEILFGKRNLRKVYSERVRGQNIFIVLKNTFIKWCGVLLGILFMFFMYWFIPEYDSVKYFAPIQESFKVVLALVLPISLFMIFMSEYLLGHKNDGTYNLGLLATFQTEKIDWYLFRDGVLEWLIRVIFLTLNFTSAVSRIDVFRTNPELFFTGSFVDIVMGIELAVFLIIIIVILPGYLFSWRVIGTDVKKVDATWFAWLFLLICYQPFTQSVFQTTFAFEPATSVSGPLPFWAHFFSGFPILTYLCGILILVCVWFHLWAEAILGIRSSNLTNKGIITNGPFWYSKHPVYLSKVIAWFLISLPFLNGASFLESMQLGLAFLVIASIYIGRSVSEEKLLSTDPDYVKYALFMDKHALFAFVGKIFPVMSYEWRYNYWKKHNFLK